MLRLSCHIVKRFKKKSSQVSFIVELFEMYVLLLTLHDTFIFSYKRLNDQSSYFHSQEACFFILSTKHHSFIVDKFTELLHCFYKAYVLERKTSSHLVCLIVNLGIPLHNSFLGHYMNVIY